MTEPFQVGDLVMLRASAYRGVICEIHYSNAYGREYGVSWSWWDPRCQEVFGIYKGEALRHVAALEQLAMVADGLRRTNDDEEVTTHGSR